MTPRQLDTALSSVTIRTRAKGMLARLAHDLEIAAAEFRADIEGDADGWSATLVFPVAKLKVNGALKSGRVDGSILSPNDRADIERKIRSEVLVGAEVVVRATGQDLRHAQLDINGPGGQQRLRVALNQDQRNGADVVFGKTSVSLKALGVREIKGPLGAFKVDDAVELAFYFVVAAADAA